MKKLLTIRRSMVVIGLAAVMAVSTTVRGDTSSVSSLRVEKASGSSSFVISKMGAIDVQDFVMENPSRLVLDFMGAKHDMTESKFDGDGRFVQRVRSSQFSFAPDQVTRIVFDLEQGVSYEVASLSKSVTVRFFKKNGDAPARKAKPMESSVSPLGMGDASRDITPIPPSNTIKAGDDDANGAQPQSKPGAVTWWSQAASAGATNAAANKSTPKTMDKKPQPQARTNNANPQTAANDNSKNDNSKSEAGTASKTETAQPKIAMPAWMKPTPKPQANASAGNGAAAGQAKQPKPVMNTSKTTWSRPSNSATTPTQTRANKGGAAFQTGMVRNRNMTIDVQNADVKTVLRSVSEFSNTNIISGPEVEGKVTAHLKNVPWRQALDIILKSHGFGWREEYGIIRVSTLEKLITEELEIQAAARKKDDLLPLRTRIMPLSFANAGEMRTALKDVLTRRGKIQVETGNNALIVSDIDKALDKIAAMVKELDRRTRQVEIVAKMVDVDYEASREMGIRWDALNLSSGSANIVGDAVIDARSAAPVGTFRVGTVQSWGQLQALVDVLEKENRANIISNPRIITADNREASILVGKQIPLIVSDEAGNPVTELTKVGIILQVTPHVNKDNSITLDLHPEVSELSAQATVQGGIVISLSEANTRLVVGNGETAVLGGLISEVESSVENGVPILKDLPIVGHLFKLTSKTSKKRELVIFVTPTIVDAGVEVGLDLNMDEDE